MFFFVGCHLNHLFNSNCDCYIFAILPLCDTAGIFNVNHGDINWKLQNIQTNTKAFDCEAFEESKIFTNDENKQNNLLFWFKRPAWSLLNKDILLNCNRRCRLWVVTSKFHKMNVIKACPMDSLNYQWRHYIGSIKDQWIT